MDWISRVPAHPAASGSCRPDSQRPRPHRRSPIVRSMRASCGNVTTLAGESLFESRDEEVNETRGGTGPHEANAPDLPGKRPEPCPNLDVELLQETPANGDLVYAVRDSDGIYSRQAF